ncbi:nucleotidyltransferase family protein [Pacificoceanicola onchidii]|uniref:nucleotidyltransferase family protein n=1 Tax=Pacificoceanicola onchidii TaxID=2562685 RepID=UPI0010A646C4|nr:nucleotidyltransferase family protein [Pacificoceanicola onchidii]
MQDIAILIPAAGASSRMLGKDKLLEPVDGVPLLRRQADRALATGCHVTVTVPDHEHARCAALSGLPVQLVAVPDAGEGMSASLRRGVALLPKGLKAVMILPGDMPDLEPEDLMRLVTGFRAVPHPMLHQATAADGTPGHPVLFPADCFYALTRLTGDQGARDVLRANKHRLVQVPLEDNRALVDLDTPEAWASWRAAAVA